MAITSFSGQYKPRIVEPYDNGLRASLRDKFDAVYTLATCLSCVAAGEADVRSLVVVGWLGLVAVSLRSALDAPVGVLERLNISCDLFNPRSGDWS